MIADRPAHVGGGIGDETGARGKKSPVIARTPTAREAVGFAPSLAVRVRPAHDRRRAIREDRVGNQLVRGAAVVVMQAAQFHGTEKHMLWAFDAPPRIAGASVFGVLGCAVSAFLGFHLFRAIQHSGRLEDYDEN